MTSKPLPFLENLNLLDINQVCELQNENDLLTLRIIYDALDGKEPMETHREMPLGLLFTKSFMIWKGMRIRVAVLKFVCELKIQATLCQELQDISVECLTLLFVPTKGNSKEFIHRLPNNAVVLFPADIVALINGKCTITQLIDYKLFRIYYLQKTVLETEFDTSLLSTFLSNLSSTHLFTTLSEVIANRQISPRDWVDHPLCDRIYSCLDRNEIQVLIGPSASGKTTLSLQIGWKVNTNSRKVKYLNIGQMGETQSLQFSEVIVEFQGRSASLLIIDDAQANPNISRFLCQALNISNKASRDVEAQFLFLTWPDYAFELLTSIPEAKAIHIRAEQVRNGIIHRHSINITPNTVNNIVTLFGSDLFLLTESLKYISENQAVPSVFDLATHFWERWQSQGIIKIETEARRVLLITSSLGRFDIPITPTLLVEASYVNPSIIDQLVRIQVLRRVLGMITLGHRSFATLIGDWLADQHVWGEIEKLGGPRNIPDMLHFHLRSLSPSKAIDSLRVLENQSGFKGNVKLSQRSSALIEIWQAFDSVLERILQQQSVDPTWGRIPSSAMFAIEALTSVGRVEDARGSIDYLRSIWTIDPQGDIILHLGDLPTNEDFEKIRERMKEEDEIFRLSHASDNWTSVEHIDIEKMHKNWLVGVLLTAEAAFDTSSLYIKQLIKNALASSLTNGAYYPERVPWVTARILLGLSSAGVTSAYSPEVRKTVDWLLKERARGGAMTNAIWQSGTGTWNSELEVSAMCTLALVRSGVDPADPRLDAVKRLIKSTKHTWPNPSTILDGALAAEAYLATGEGWDEIVDEVRQISLWTKAESFWKSASKRSTETFAQSCRVAQIASNLINIGWSAVRSDLPSLVSAFTVPKTTSQPTMAITTDQIAIDFQTQHRPVIATDSNLETLKSLQRVSLSSLSVVGSYQRYNEKTRNRLKDWCSRIEDPIRKKSLMHENFLIWAPPGSGKTFLIQEFAKSMANAVHYVELNLAAMKRENFHVQLEDIVNKTDPVLCLIDEIDARSEESWPYEDIFPRLDSNLSTTSSTM